MDKFWNSEEGKIISHTIHEHNSAIGLISGTVYYLRKIKDDGELLSDELEQRLDKIEEYLRRCKEAVDYAYKELKSIHDTNS